ncbi:MAG: helix-turn-helix domain-containing protein [Kofleriaceae bacterium]
MPHHAPRPGGGGRISIAGGRAAYVGPALDLSPHRTAAAVIAIALHTPFELTLFTRPRPVTATRRLAMIPPATLHHLRATGAMAFVYLDALSDDHARLQRLDLAAVGGRLARLVRDDGPAVDVEALCRAVGLPQRVIRDARIARVVRQIQARPQDFARARQAAAHAGVSASRFHELFREAVGMPFRRYRLWRRMAVVVRDLAGGASLTRAALDAGFASSAHLSAAFKAMFGLAPSRLQALAIHLDVR